jgi:hypothetical protein
MNTKNLSHAAIVLFSCFFMLACGGDDDNNNPQGSGGFPNTMTSRFPRTGGGLPGTGDSGGTGFTPPRIPGGMPPASQQMCKAGADACTQCIVAACGEPCATCASESACTDAFDCISGCTTDTCINNCGSPAALNLVSDLVNCTQQRCSTACSDSGSGSDTPSGGSSGGNSCDACVDATCSQEQSACANNSACVDLVNCCANGSEAQCEQCFQNAPASAAQAANNFAQCFSDCGC